MTNETNEQKPEITMCKCGASYLDDQHPICPECMIEETTKLPPQEVEAKGWTWRRGIMNITEDNYNIYSPDGFIKAVGLSEKSATEIVNGLNELDRLRSSMGKLTLPDELEGKSQPVDLKLIESCLSMVLVRHGCTREEILPDWIKQSLKRTLNSVLLMQAHEKETMQEKVPSDLKRYEAYGNEEGEVHYREDLNGEWTKASEVAPYIVKLQGQLSAVQRFRREDAWSHINEMNELRSELKQAKELMQEFVDRVDKGEIRSKHTYAKFTALLTPKKDESAK